jgi:hypothetical protein
MNTSQNPKVLHYVIRDKLSPVFERIEKLAAKEKDINTFLNNSAVVADESKERVNNFIDNYKNNERVVRERLENNIHNLDALIDNQLYNPNVPFVDDGGSGEMIPETPLITDKALTSLCYGFIKNGSPYILAGISNRGIAAGPDTGVNSVFSFKTPEKQSFPSYYPNDIVFESDNTALIPSNNGLVLYTISSETYTVRTTSFGMNANEVKRIIPVKNNNENTFGYIIGTKFGISFSPNLNVWLDVDPEFKMNVTAFHVVPQLDHAYSFVFIGTVNGIYYFDINEYLETGSSPVQKLSGLMDSLPNIRYIHALAYNDDNNTLYIATENGVITVKNIFDYILSGVAAPPSSDTISMYRGINGLSSTLCYDISIMPNHKIIIATGNGLTITEDFISFSYITKKVGNTTNTGLNSYMCTRIIRKNDSLISILHPNGLTENIAV